MMDEDKEIEISTTMFKGVVVGAATTGPLSTLVLSYCTELSCFNSFLGGSVVCLLTGIIPALFKVYEFSKQV